MLRLRSIAVGLRALFRKEQMEREMDEELRAYLDAAMQEKMGRGMSQEEALREACREMGSIDEVKDQIRSVGWEARLATLPARLKGVRMLKPRLITSSVIVMAALVLVGWWSISTFWLVRPLRTFDAVMLYIVTADGKGIGGPHMGHANGLVPISMTPIVYTPEAKKARVKGSIVADFDVGSAGNVEGVKITAVSLSSSQSAELEESVVSAVRTWKFKPATKKGSPVPVSVYLAVDFM